jgi:hypothetical protein
MDYRYFTGELKSYSASKLENNLRFYHSRQPGSADFNSFPLFLPPLNFKKGLMLMDNLIYLVPVMGAIGLLYTFIKFNWVSKQDAGNAKMKEISDHIAEGAMAFLKAEWKILGYFVVLVSLLLVSCRQPIRTHIG